MPIFRYMRNFLRKLIFQGVFYIKTYLKHILCIAIGLKTNISIKNSRC